MKKSTSKNKKQKFKKSTRTEKKKISKSKGPMRIVLKITVLLLIVAGIVKYYDLSGMFEPDQQNNHTQKKWDSFYKFTKSNDVDVVMVGNSHMYNGINPKTLSNTLKANCFILASPGTRISDTYYCLKEAITVNKPKLVVVETYGIKNFDQYNLKPQSLSDQFKSFVARRNIIQKIASMPFLYNANNYLQAWSNTIRNHSFILSNQEQIEKNKAIKKQKKKEDQSLYLGRFIAYQDGIQSEVLQKYRNEGSPVDGADYKYSEIADDYVQAIAKLCKKNDIKLLFLTLPMYKDHVKNYGLWKQELAKTIDKTGAPWIDMQEGEYYSGFTTASFQNTYKTNQHLTYSGSVLASYKLKDYMKENYADILPDRSKDKNWHKLFYGEEGYFENHPVKENDKEHKILASKLNVGNIEIDKIIAVKYEKQRRLIAKINKEKYKVDWSKYKIRMLIKYTDEKKTKQAYADLAFNKYINSDDFYLFQQSMKDIQIIDISNIKFINN